MKRLSALLSLPALAVLGALLFLSLQRMDQLRPLSAEAPIETPRYELLDAEWTRLDAQGAPEFSARADSIVWFDDQSAHLSQPEIHAFGGSGSPWRLTAPEGSMAAGSRDILLTGTVLATGQWPDGGELGFNTDRLWLDMQGRLLRTDADVSLQGPGRHVLATGMTADWQGRDLRFLSNVQARYEPRGKTKKDAPRS